MDIEGFDPRISGRRRWRRAAASIAICALLSVGGLAVVALGLPSQNAGGAHMAGAAGVPAPAAPVQLAEAPEIQPAPRSYAYAASSEDIRPDIPAVLAQPAGPRAEPEPQGDRVAGLHVERVTVQGGDTLGRLLTRAGVSTQQSAEAISALKTVWDPRSLKVGQDVTIYLHTSALRKVSTRPDAPNLVGLSLKPDIDRTVAVALDDEGAYTAREVVLELQRELVRAQGSIDSALYIDANEAGATDRIIANFARMFSFSVDIQREIQPGDSFEILYEQFRMPNGELARTGEIFYASLETGGRQRQLYRFESADGVDYFDEAGVSTRRFLMKTPINGARLSSRFGMRMHPIQGYNKMHPGTDFAAPRGTPIYAAGDGVIVKQYRSSSYGNYIRIKHSGTWETAYAHMHNFASGMREGRRVKQGEVIGYVGTTGRSTGNHLHYEVLKDGTQVDSMSVQVPTGTELEGDELQRFAAARDVLRQDFAAAPDALDALDAPKVAAAEAISDVDEADRVIRTIAESMDVAGAELSR